MARSKITKRTRLFLWIVIAIITAPFALVLAFSSWLQDLVAGDQFPLYRRKVQKKEKKDD
jgi:hypothetical protein